MTVPEGSSPEVAGPPVVTLRWTLRRRLVAVVIGLLVVVAAAMALASTLALRGSLVDQLDDRVVAAGERAVRAEGRPRAVAPQGPGDRQRGRVGDPPTGLGALGQSAGTVTLSVVDGMVRAARIDERGDVELLDDAQVAALETVVPDGRPQTVTLEGLGAHRVVASTTPTGGLVVTGLSLDAVSTTVDRYLLVEAVVAVVGICLAGLAGSALVRREMAPLERVAATATRVAELPLRSGEVSLVERVPVHDTDPATEVGRVGAALNRMLGHVEEALAARHASETQVRQFVADASHELRTPLAAIRGYAELVRRMPADLPPDALRAMERVESESRRMTTLVEDMLLLARLDAGRPLERRPVDLVALVVDAVADAHAAGPDHGWHLDLDEATPAATVPGDEHRLRQVLVNLLGNARVHTPAGTQVVTTVRVEGSDVRVAVKDDGPGIPPDLLPHLFRRFARGDQARSPGTGSSGLGLAIAQAVVHAHGGTLDVDGTPGTTTFTVRLPRGAPHPPR